jgi:hypothetical protein
MKKKRIHLAKFFLIFIYIGNITEQISNLIETLDEK